MSETLFSMARSNIMVSHTLLRCLGDDPRELNIVGYHLQQTVELCLKYMLEAEGFDYPKTHSISVLYDTVESAGIIAVLSDELQEKLLLYADAFTSWEAQGRYIKDWFVEIRRIKIGFELTNSLMIAVSAWSGERYTNLDWPISSSLQKPVVSTQAMSKMTLTERNK